MKGRQSIVNFSNPYSSILEELSEDVQDMDSSDMAVYLRWLIFHNRLDTVMSLFITRCKVSQIFFYCIDDPSS
jgi:hypothetical protein